MMTVNDNNLKTDSMVGSHNAGMKLAVIFTATIFLSATLLFSVQPMFTKLVLPLLGGASNVWNTAMVFFQAMLLGGYIYAHLITKYLPIKAQVAVHLGVTAFGFIFLPLALPAEITVPDGGTPTFWLLGLFALTVGVPFFALSANAPLLQRWFSLTDHKDASDPYFLYSSSNAASLLILCAYPFLIEPTLRLGEQTSSWAIGYVALFAMIIVTAAIMSRRLVGGGKIKTEAAVSTRLTYSSMAFWVVLAFIPSSLMLGVTSYMTNNIASAPFLWILPLALYLLTFVIVFARRPIVSTATIAKLFPWVVIFALFTMMPNSSFDLFGFTINTSPSKVMKIPLLLLAYFLISLYCHSILVGRRPDSSKLTTYYILMSLGGVLGGAFNALLAPLIFDAVYEFILVLVLVLFLRPDGFVFPKSGEKPWRLFFFGVGAAIFNAVMLFQAGGELQYILFISFVILAISSMRFNTGRLFKAGVFSVIIICTFVFNMFGSNNFYQDRSFYSVMGVKIGETEYGKIHRFIHGDTLHNYQIREEGLYTVPTAYYIEGGSIHTAVQAARKLAGDNMDVAVVGLGAGAMTCYQNPGESWTFYEIDPAVVKLARNPDLFSYVDRCDPDADIRVGDARQKLAELPEGSQDLIVIDAFSSDSIPAHLVTREALQMYQTRLKPTGLIFFHTSNKFLDVTSVVSRLAEDANLASRYLAIEEFPSNPHKQAGVLAQGMLVGPEELIQQVSAGDENFQIWKASKYVKVWTDDYSSILGTLIALNLKDGEVESISAK